MRHTAGGFANVDQSAGGLPESHVFCNSMPGLIAATAKPNACKCMREKVALEMMRGVSWDLTYLCLIVQMVVGTAVKAALALHGPDNGFAALWCKVHGCDHLMHICIVHHLLVRNVPHAHLQTQPDLTLMLRKAVIQPCPSRGGGMHLDTWRRLWCHSSTNMRMEHVGEELMQNRAGAADMAGRAGAGSAGQGRAGQGRAGQGRAGQGRCRAVLTAEQLAAGNSCVKAGMAV